MSTPQNRYYFRSRGIISSGENSPELVDNNSGDSSLNLSDLEDTIFDQNLNSSFSTTVSDSVMATNFHIVMPPFHGIPGERADERLTWSRNFADAHNFNEDRRRQTMPFYLKDHALAWYNSQSSETKGKLRALTTVLQTRFNGSDGLDSDLALLTLSQQPNESCANYFTRILKVTSNRDYPESLLTGIALKGLYTHKNNCYAPKS